MKKVKREKESLRQVLPSHQVGATGFKLKNLNTLVFGEFAPMPGHLSRRLAVVCMTNFKGVTLSFEAQGSQFTDSALATLDGHHVTSLGRFFRSTTAFSSFVRLYFTHAPFPNVSSSFICASLFMLQ